MVYSPKDIQSVRLFDGLDSSSRLELFEVGKRLQLSQSQLVLKEGEMSHCMYAILNGSVRVTKGIRGELEHLATLVKGDCFGEMTLLDGKTRSATVTTLEPTILLEFDMSALGKLFEKNPRIASQVYQNLARLLSSRLRQFQDRVQEISWRDDEISWGG